MIQKGVPENDAEAVKWFRKAADQGKANAQYNLGNMYANGKGVPENNTRAIVAFEGGSFAYSWISLGNINSLIVLADCDKF